MTHRSAPTRPADPLDELVAQLLVCGGLLSQIISRMVEFQSSGESAPDSTPIPELAHAVIRGVLDDVRKRHSRRDIALAAAIVREAAEGITENIFFVGPELN